MIAAPATSSPSYASQVLSYGCAECRFNLVASFPDGAKLLATAERLRLEGIVSKRRTAAYSSGECRDWRKVKTVAWREANRERWRLFERETPQ
jgi:hypothetical protein